MNIIVTGGSGFIGKNLIPRLLSLGHKVSVIDVSSDSIEAYPWFKKINFYKLRIDSSDIETVLKKINAEVLIHLAWSDLPNYENIIHFKNNLYQQIKFLTCAAENNIKNQKRRKGCVAQLFWLNFKSRIFEIVVATAQQHFL